MEKKQQNRFDALARSMADAFAGVPVEAGLAEIAWALAAARAVDGNVKAARNDAGCEPQGPSDGL